MPDPAAEGNADANTANANTANGWDAISDANLLELFEVIDFDNLVAVAEKSDRFRRIIGQHFMSDPLRLHEREICIARVPESGLKPVHCHLINGQASALKFLTHFGHMVTRLNVIGHNIDRAQFDEIGQLIDRHCAATLVGLRLEQVQAMPIGGWHNTFPKLERFALDRAREAQSLRIDTMFPRLRSLQIERSRTACIGYHFPHLQHLTVDAGLLVENPHLMKALQLNPQIRSLRTDSPFNAQFLRFIGTSVPDLQSFGIDYTAFTDAAVDASVRFKNVQDFTLNAYNLPQSKHFLLHAFDFPQLTAVEIACRAFGGEMMAFLKKNVHLATVKIMETTPTYAEWTELMQALPQLKAIHTHWINGGQSAGVLDVMRNENAIETITLTTSTQGRASLLDALPDTWRCVGEKETQYEQILTFSRNSAGEWMSTFSL